MESRCVVVEANRHLKLLPTSTLDIYQVFDHIVMLSIGIQQHPYTVIPTLLGSDFGVLGHLWSQNEVEADIHLKLLPTSILHIYKVFEHLNMLSIAYSSSPTQY